MAMRDLCQPYFFDLEDFMEAGLPGASEIHHSPLHCINNASMETTYPSIVMKFWNSAYYKPQKGLCGTGTKHAFSVCEIILEDYLGYPNLGKQYEDSWWSEYKAEDICKTVYSIPSPTNREKTQFTSLSQAAKLIHLFITHVCCPRYTNLSKVLDHDVFIIYHVLKKVPLNPVMLVFNHLKRTLNDNNEAIPYGFLLTLMEREIGGTKDLDDFAVIQSSVIHLKFLHNTGIDVPNMDVSDDDYSMGKKSGSSDDDDEDYGFYYDHTPTTSEDSGDDSSS